MVNLLQYINVPVFLISFAIGMFFVYIMMPDTRKIFVYPTPENVEILQYKDRTGECFRFTQKEVPCPKNEDEISKIPMQS